MTMMQPMDGGAERVMAALIAGLELEFGKHAGAALAGRFIAAEECNFTWEARLEERWLGTFEAAGEEEDEGECELDRVAIFGRWDGQWFAAICIVDGEGRAHGMVARRAFAEAQAAREAYRALH